MGADGGQGLENQVNTPPQDFEQYLHWRATTSEGKAWWRDQMWQHSTLFVCPQCDDQVWIFRGEEWGDSIPCPWPCGGLKRRQKRPEFWQEER